MIARTVAALIASSAPVLAQSPQWGLAASYPVNASLGFQNATMDIADFNLDGRLDILVVEGGPTANASVLLGQPNGTFIVMSHDYSTGLYGPLVVGRFDGDSIPDALTVKLMHGNGDGTFTQAAVQPVGLGQVSALGSADLNNDGHADVVASGFRLAYGTSSGALTVPFVYPTCSGDYITIADVDADGDLDAVTCGNTSVAILRNIGMGTFATQCYGRGSTPSRVAVADYTDDGVPDMIVDRRLWTAQPNGVYVPGTVITNLGIGWYESFDCEGDGRMDLAASGQMGSQQGWLIARCVGPATFDTTCFLAVPQSSGVGCIRLANVLGDSRPEVLALCDGAVRVYRNLAPDCDDNGVDDPVELANGWAADCDGNGVPDSCQTDCDNSGTPDVCQIAAQPSLDLNSNGMLDSCEPVGTPYCFGDGTGAACPCDPGQAGPAGGGCLNAGGNGGRLRAVGNAQVSLDSVTMHASGMDVGSFGLLFQGTAQQAAGQGSPFGDGLLCVNGTITRLIVRLAATGSLDYGRAVSGDPALSTLGNVPVGGATLHYQVWYRDSAAFCTAFTYNLTNGVSVAWVP